MDRGAWWATVYRVTKSRIQLKRLSIHTHSLGLLQTVQLWPFLHVLHISSSSHVHASMLNIHRNGITGTWCMFSLLIPKMLMFTLAISCWTTYNLPWFMDLTFQIPMQYCSLQQQTLLPSPVTSKTGCCFCFGSLSSFFLELFPHWSPVAY